MIEITCPNCGAIRKMSLIENVYEGPYRCWKCRSLFTIKIDSGQLVSCNPLSEEDFEKMQEADDA